jgi:hypothetical protein
MITMKILGFILGFISIYIRSYFARGILIIQNANEYSYQKYIRTYKPRSCTLIYSDLYQHLKINSTKISALGCYLFKKKCY